MVRVTRQASRLASTPDHVRGVLDVADDPFRYRRMGIASIDFGFAANLLEPDGTGWQPWTPAQTPPDGTWDGWVFMAGRGTGKTDAGSEYVKQHVHGPACIPGPQPHRIAIIAPTLGDARLACVEGETGILRHDPTARFLRGSLQELQWPDGSVAHLFGTNTERDVDRLRAGGNRSIAVGTLIETATGPRPIETIQPGDLVYTAGGLRPVIASWNHGIRPLWRLTTQRGHTLTLTPDHKVWTPRGWTRLDHLAAGSNIATWNGTVTAGSYSATDTGHVASRSTADQRHCSCTGQCGNTTTDRSPTGGTSTTSTASKTTTASRTSRPATLLPTTLTTARSLHPSGTQPAAANRRRTLSQSSNVNGVTRTLRGNGAPGSVQNGVGDDSSGILPRPSECGHASCAAAISTVHPGPPLLLVPDRVATISPGNAEGPVWDLTVAGEHAFVADGIYVANCLAWLEEFAAWPRLQDGFEQMEFGLRSGPNPHWFATTTPKPRAVLKAQLADPGVVVTHARTVDNPHLPERRKQKLLARYGGTRIGRQELDGELVDDVEGATWTIDDIEPYRVAPVPFDTLNLERVVVAVDPPGGATEAGIVAAGVRPEPTMIAGVRQVVDHFYILADRSLKAAPNKWARTAIGLYGDVKADRVIGESNYGGDMVVTVIGNNVRDIDGHVATDTVTATRGKQVRAEPVHDLYQQGRVHHVGRFVELEEEMTTWVPVDAATETNPVTGDSEDSASFRASKWSPNRLDALVWAVTYLSGMHQPDLWFA